MDQQNVQKQMPGDLQRWAATRQKGKRRFILVSGLLCYGLPMFAIMTFFVNRRPDRPITLMMVGISAVTWALGGAAFGWIMWHLTERRYQKFIAANGGKPASLDPR